MRAERDGVQKTEVNDGRIESKPGYNLKYGAESLERPNRYRSNGNKTRRTQWRKQGSSGRKYAA